MPVLGLGSRLTLAKETTYGTASAGTYRAIPLLSESLKENIDHIISPTLRGGFMVQSAAAVRNGKQMVRGDVQTLLHESGASLLWESMLGSIATTGAGPYTHTATIPASTVDMPAYTIQVGLGGTTTSYTRKRVLGAVCESWQIAAAAGEAVTLGMTWVGQDGETAEATATTGTVPTSQTYYDWRSCVATIGGLTLDCITSFTIQGNNNLNTDRFCLGQTLMSRPKRNGPAEITGSFDIYLPGTADTTTPTAILTAMQTVSTVAVVATFTSGSNTCTITTTALLNPTEYPVVSDGGELRMTIPFTVYRATDAATDANAITVACVNSDSVA